MGKRFRLRRFVKKHRVNILGVIIILGGFIIQTGIVFASIVRDVLAK